MRGVVTFLGLGILVDFSTSWTKMFGALLVGLAVEFSRGE